MNSQNDKFQQLINNQSVINSSLKKYKDLHDINSKIELYHEDFFQFLKKFKIFHELTSLIDPNEPETSEWKKLLKTQILDNLNTCQLDSIQNPEDSNLIVLDAKKISSLLEQITTGILTLFDENSPFENYILNLENRINIDGKLIENQQEISDENKNILEEMGQNMLDFLKCINQGDNSSFFGNFSIFKSKIIEFLKNTDEYYKKRKEVNKFIDNPNIRKLFEKEAIDIGGMSYTEIEELIGNLQEMFPDIKNLLKLSIKKD